MDYFAAGKLEEEVLPAVIEGLSAACRANGCALLAEPESPEALDAALAGAEGATDAADGPRQPGEGS